MPIKTGAIEGATKGNPLLFELLSEIAQWQTNLANALGFDPLPSPQSNTNPSASPPPQIKGLDVQGANGQFVVTITPAKGVKGQVLYLIQSSRSVPFEASNTVDSYGPSPGLVLNVNQPNETRYWRVLSKYTGSDYSSAFQTGAISSGLIQQSTVSPVLTNLKVISRKPNLVQDGLNPVINVSALDFSAGSGVILSYDSGVVTTDDQDELLTFSDYYVYADDPTKSGGSVVYKATQDPSVLTASDSRITFGSISLREGGGGVDFPEGVEGGPAAGTLVALANGTTKMVQDLRKGDIIIGLDSHQIERVVAPVEMIQGVPCFTITTGSGDSVTISSDHTLQFGPGGRAAVIDIVPGDLIDTSIGQDSVVSVVYAGLQTVYSIPLSRHKYHLGNNIWCG